MNTQQLLGVPTLPIASDRALSFAEFRISLETGAPPRGLSEALQGLWWIAKGDWHRAHDTVQAVGGSDAAWVHAHLHRIDGDIGNARFWYRRAGRPVETTGLEAEWSSIVLTLLRRFR